ncbi:MAG: MOSC domain-containing protein [bacterium]|nr:MOSC domain-containing protein [bacterium]
MDTTNHRVLKLWIRPIEGAALEERDSLEVVEGEGIVGDHTQGRLRHVTLVFEDDWAEATRDLGHDVDPVARRANVLLRGGNGGRLVGTTIELGGVELEIKGTVPPCPVMDTAAPGLQEALKPGARAGIWGRAKTTGTIRVGDAITRDA